MVNKTSIGEDVRKFRSNFVDQLKSTDSGYRYEARLMVQKYSDHQAVAIATKEPTDQRLTERLIFPATSIDDPIPQTRYIR